MGMKADPKLRLRMEHERAEAAKGLRHAAHVYHAVEEKAESNQAIARARKNLEDAALAYAAAELIAKSLEDGGKK